MSNIRHAIDPNFRAWCGDPTATTFTAVAFLTNCHECATISRLQVSYSQDRKKGINWANETIEPYAEKDDT